MAEGISDNESNLLLAAVGVGGIASLPTLPYTAVLAYEAEGRGYNVSPDEARLSVALGIGVTAYSIIKRDFKPAAVVFGLSSGVALARYCKDKVDSFRLPPA